MVFACGGFCLDGLHLLAMHFGCFRLDGFHFLAMRFGGFRLDVFHFLAMGFGGSAWMVYISSQFASVVSACQS